MTIVQLFKFNLPVGVSRSGRGRLRLLSLAFCLLFSLQALADEITLNLKDADIRALISTVSKFTGKNFIIDPRVKAKVTVISAQPLTPEAVYEVFLSVLQVHGYAAVPTGSVIKIVPEVNAKQGPLPLAQKKGTYPGDELITKIIRLDHVPASQLVPILRPLVPQQGHLAAYNPTNTLIITDHAGNIQRLMKIIANVDRPDSDELEIIPLKHASASELVRILNSLNTATAKDTSKKVRLAADDRTNSILVSGDRSSRLKIRTTISYLDTPLEDGGGNTHVIYLKYAKAENLAKLLTGLKEQNRAGKMGVSKFKGKVIQNKPTSGSVISQNAIIQADEETNALIITADPNTVKNLKAVIRQLDIRRAQVLIEAIIAEITSTNDKELGVGVAVDGTQRDSGALPVGLSNFAGIGDLLLSALGGSAPTSAPSGMSFAIGGENGGVRYGALLRALQTDQNTNILSTPNIVTLDNEEAELIVGQNLPFVTGSFTGTGSTNPSNPFQTIERQDVGLTLKVTPQINEGDTVKLVLEQETSTVIPGTFEQGIATRKRSIKTSVLVDDGGILILGGLIQEEVTDTESKVPLLGDIPVIGFLFRTENTSRTKANLMVFLRPTILRDYKDATFVTNEKYNFIRGVESEPYNAEDGSYGLLDSAVPRLPPIEDIDRSKQNVEKNKSEAEPVDDGWDDDDDFL